MKQRPLFFLILSLAVLLDQLTKYLASTFINPYEPIEVLPVLTLVNVKNVGAAFGLFSSLGNVFFIVVTLVAIAIILFLAIKEKDGFVGLTLILSGAVGNLIDRLVFGHVRDFIDVHACSYHWPAFNVADSALTVGIAVLIIGSLFKKK
jgi:signal peptidase II